jgi:hypothetical protein
MYTLEIYKTDKRTKAGERLLEKRDGCGTKGSSKWAVGLHYAIMYPSPKYRIELHDTMVTKRNLGTGEDYEERYDTPYSCSPSTETYWCM